MEVSLQPLSLSNVSVNQPGLFPQADPSAVRFRLSNLPFISMCAVGLSALCHTYTQLASWYGAEQLRNETSPAHDAPFALAVHHRLRKRGHGAMWGHARRACRSRFSEPAPSGFCHRHDNLAFHPSTHSAAQRGPRGPR